MTINANHFFIGLGLFVLGVYVGRQQAQAAALATAGQAQAPDGVSPWGWTGY
jgi:hypothetical protein